MADVSALAIRPHTCTFNSVALKGAKAFRFRYEPGSEARVDSEDGDVCIARAFYDYLCTATLEFEDSDVVADFDVEAAATLPFNSAKALAIAGLDLFNSSQAAAVTASAIVKSAGGGFDRTSSNASVDMEMLFGATGAAPLTFGIS